MPRHPAVSYLTRAQAFAVLLGSLCGAAQAQSLSELFQAASDYDAVYRGARLQADATLARAQQARAGILPSVNFNAGASLTSQTSTLASYDARNYNTQSASINAVQPLYRPGNWASYEQGTRQLDLAQAQLQSAQQDLALRVSQAYFDVLASADSLAFVRSQKAAIAQQLASAQRNFELGSATVVDTRDAQARYDLVLAQEIAADNDWHVKALALDQLVGKTDSQPLALRPGLLAGSTAIAGDDSVQPWLTQSEQNSPDLKQLAIALDVAVLETRKAEAAVRPTLDLVGSYGATNNNGTSSAPASYQLNQASIGVVFNLPLYSGSAAQNRIKETLALEEKARADLQAAQRSVAQNTRSAYLSLQTARAQVSAYEAAQASSQSALDANTLGYQVGVKINIDVLNAQSQLFDTKARLARARYDVLLGELKLRQVSGVLQPADLERISAQLQN